jgi:hypothetical protein
MRKIAALYVIENGIYSARPDVECWGEKRDARQYAGPWPVVAHPPCARWGSYWFGGPTARVRRLKGDDDGCFAAALASVRRWGGILEHPKGSHAWKHFDLAIPPAQGGWVKADEFAGFTCQVEQGHFGHMCRKPTWLYASGIELRALPWWPSEACARIDLGCHRGDDRRKKIKRGQVAQLSHRQRASTPLEFAELLLSMARTARRDLWNEDPDDGSRETRQLFKGML